MIKVKKTEAVICHHFHLLSFRLLDKQKCDSLHPPGGVVSSTSGGVPGEPSNPESHMPPLHPPHPFLLAGPSTSAVAAQTLHIPQPPKVHVPGPRTPPTSAPASVSAAAAAFRQQPPPMKVG